MHLELNGDRGETEWTVNCTDLFACLFAISYSYWPLLKCITAFAMFNPLQSIQFPVWAWNIYSSTFGNTPIVLDIP